MNRQRRPTPRPLLPLGIGSVYHGRLFAAGQTASESHLVSPNIRSIQGDDPIRLHGGRLSLVHNVFEEFLEVGVRRKGLRFNLGDSTIGQIAMQEAVLSGLESSRVAKD